MKTGPLEDPITFRSVLEREFWERCVLASKGSTAWCIEAADEVIRAWRVRIGTAEQASLDVTDLTLQPWVKRWIADYPSSVTGSFRSAGPAGNLPKSEEPDGETERKSEEPDGETER